MAKFWMAALAAVCLAVPAWSGPAFAGCSEGGKQSCSGVCCKKAAEDASVEDKGTVRSVDPVKKELVFSPDGSDKDMTLQVESTELGMLKPGDYAKVTYTKGETNVATQVIKLFRIKIQPNPCWKANP